MLDELRVHRGLRAFEVFDVLGRADAGDDVFALRVAQILAEKVLVARVRDRA